MESSGEYKLPLSELLAILKANGYEVSIERILEVQSALLSSHVSKLNLSELKFIVAPILAKNAEDQKNIYKIIDSYISGRVRHTEKKITPFDTWMKNKRLIFGLKVIGFVMVVVTAVLLYLFQRDGIRKTNTTITPQQVQPVNPSPLAVDTNRQNESVKRTPKSTPGVTGNVQYSGKTIKPTRLNIILQVSGAFGIGLGGILYYFIFFERRKRMQAKKKTQDGDEGFGAGKNGDNKTGPEQLVNAVLQFPEKEYLVQKTKEFSVIRSNLKKAGRAEKPDLNVKKSVYATTMNAGFPTLAFDDKWKERKYLILTDNQEQDAHITHLLDFLVHFLESSNISIVKYSYSGDIRTLVDRSNEIIYLDDLPYDFPRHHLIITGDCRSFFTTETNLLHDDLQTIFQQWPSRSVITTMPFQDWSYREEQLQNNSFHVVPAEISTIELLSRAITEESQIKPGHVAARIRDKYAILKYDFTIAGEIRKYLDNEELFQVICSLAVYPRLDWNLTLALFDAILKKNEKAAASVRLDYDTLLKISRIPCLSKGQLDSSLRLQLFDFLQPETEIIARETILEVLKETDPFVTPGSPASKELRVQVKVNSFFLYAHDQQKYKEHADVKKDFLEQWNNLDDWTLKERKKNGLMPVNNKGEQATVEEFILQEEQFEKRNVTFLRVALLTLPTAALYILFSLFKPPLVYLDSFEKISFVAIVKKDSTCKKELTQVVISKLDRFDTIAMKKDSGINYIRVDNTEYGRSVGLSFLFSDNTFADLSVEAKDSVAIVSLKCR